MPFNSNAFLKVIAAWPIVIDDLFDPNIPSPWKAGGITIPPSTTPLQPTLAVLFTRGLATQVYADDAALSGYVFLTSITDPTATNIVAFQNVAFNASKNLLTFQPAALLTPGQRYQATIRSNVADIDGRLIDSAYSWEFDVDPGLYQGLPVPVLQSPPDQTSVISVPLTFIWGTDKNYTPASGYNLSFNLRVFTNPDANPRCYDLPGQIWSGTIPNTGSVTGAFLFNQATPAFSTNTLKSPELYFWTVQSILSDASGNTLALSMPSAASSFLVNVPSGLEPPEGGPGGAVWPPVLQKDPLVPPQALQVLIVGPSPGTVLQDASAFTDG